jgi:hypothetical protein
MRTTLIDINLILVILLRVGYLSPPFFIFTQILAPIINYQQSINDTAQKVLRFD